MYSFTLHTFEELAIPTESNRRSRDRSLLGGLAKLFPQFLVLTIGGALVSAMFQFFGQIRDEKAQRANFEKQSFLELRKDLDQLIADRVIVMDRVKARLSSGDYGGALALKRTDYDKAVAAWNQNVDRLLRSLKRLNECRAAEPRKLEDCDDKVPLPAKDCIIDYYYDIPWDEQRRDKTGQVCRPRSVHFAFKNAGYRLSELFNSDWSDCLELTQSLVARAKKECSKQPLPAYNKSSIDEITHCLDNVKEVRRSELEICNAEKDAVLNSQLAADLLYVRERWGALDEWLNEIERHYGTSAISSAYGPARWNVILSPPAAATPPRSAP